MLLSGKFVVFPFIYEQDCRTYLSSNETKMLCFFQQILNIFRHLLEQSLLKNMRKRRGEEGQNLGNSKECTF